MAPARRRATLALVPALLIAGLGFVGPVWGAFSGRTGNSGNQVTAAADWVAPTASASVIRKSEGGIPGYIHQGGTYRVYANVTDTGNPASGIATVSGDVGAISTGQTSAPLSSGSFTIAGQTHNYGSSALTADASLAAGTYTFSLTSTDLAGNSGTQTGFSVVVDNTAPTGTDITSANKAGGTLGRAEAGDTITFTYSEPIDPGSITSDWTGAAALSAVVRLSHGGGVNDSVKIYNSTNSVQLPLGSVNLGRTDYAPTNLTFGATGTASTIVVSGNSFVVTLGTASATAHTAANTGTVRWTTAPPAGATDRAGNTLTASVVSVTRRFF